MYKMEKKVSSHRPTNKSDTFTDEELQPSESFHCESEKDTQTHIHTQTCTIVKAIYQLLLNGLVIQVVQFLVPPLWPES